MTDRVKGVYVAFERDIRVDDVEVIVNAIRMIKGVAGVEQEQFISNSDDWMNRQQVRMELQPIILDFLEKLRKG